jgi:hypothetical protein
VAVAAVVEALAVAGEAVADAAVADSEAAGEQPSVPKASARPPAATHRRGRLTDAIPLIARKGRISGKAFQQPPDRRASTRLRRARR